jgi:hypothetical protein
MAHLSAASERSSVGAALPAASHDRGTIGWWCKTRDLRMASVRIRAALVMRALEGSGERAEWFDPSVPGRYCSVVISKRYDDQTVRTAEALRAVGCRVVLDLCDNHFVAASEAPHHEHRVVNLRALARLAHAITVSAEPLRAIVARECPEAVPAIVIGDLRDDLSVVPMPPHRWPAIAWKRWRERAHLEALPPGTTRLAWFGNAEGRRQQSGMADLQRIWPLLEAVHRRHPLHLTVISNSRARYREMAARAALPSRYVEWDPWTFDALMALQQVALIPATDNEFTACKSDNRAVSAFCAGLAVIADRIPSYAHFGDAIFFGDVQSGLAAYATDAALRAADAQRGRARALDSSDGARILARWLAACGCRNAIASS